MHPFRSTQTVPTPPDGEADSHECFPDGPQDLADCEDGSWVPGDDRVDDSANSPLF